MESKLPTGGCNYHDLSQPIANHCGCQSFWLRKRPRKARRRSHALRANRISEERRSLIENEVVGLTAIYQQECQEEEGDDEEDVGNCHCGHHACFHSIDHPPRTALAQGASRRHSLQISDTEASIRLDRSGVSLAASGISMASGTTTERDPCSSEQSPSVPTARRIKPHYQPSQLGSELGSKPSSQNTNIPILDIPMFLSLGGRLEANTTPVKNLESTTASATASTTTTISPSDIVDIRRGLADLRRDFVAYLALLRADGDQLKLHNERLETVETFGSVLEEMKEKLELIEDRSIECENKVLSFEDRLGDRLAPVEAFLESRSEKRKHSRQGDGSIRRKRRKRGQEGLGDSSSQQEVSLPTTASFTTTMSASTSLSETPPSNTKGNKEAILGVLEGYESRFLELEDVAPPTISRPWVIEVVLLPPAPLKGIWVDPYAQSETGTQYESSNPQSTNTTSGLTYSRRALGEPETPGMVPKSFGVSSRVYRRLHSRGFVRALGITAGTARDVAIQIESSFSELLDWCRSFEPDSQASSSQQAPTTTPTKPIMSSSAWQPLRKVHKQTALEYLRPGEMIDGIWTVEFLRGTCLMKGRRKVLYITPLPSSGSSTITWSDIKSLPKFTETPIEKEVSHDIPKPEGSDDECWNCKPFLDEPVISFTTAIHSPGSSFGPFQLEEEVPDPAGAPSPQPSVPFPFRRRSRKGSMASSSTSGRRKIGRKLFRGASPTNTGSATPASCIAGTGRSNSYPPDGAGGLIRRASSGSRGGGAREDPWELSPATLGWFTQNPLAESCSSSNRDSQHTTLGGEEALGTQEGDADTDGDGDGDESGDADGGYESADRESNDS